MTTLDLAALIAAGAFVALVVLLWRALTTTAPVLTDLRRGINEFNAATGPVLREISTAQAAHAAELERISAELTRLSGDITRTSNEITRVSEEITRIDAVMSDLKQASESANQAAAHAEHMTQLIAETVGTPLLKTASTAYALKTALTSKAGRKERS